MNIGSGSIGFTGITLPAPAPGPPFVATSADNGLSVDPGSGRIVLGQDVGAVGNPAILLSNREIPMGGFSFELVNGVGAAKQFSVDPANGLYQLGDISGVGNGLALYIDDTGNTVEIGIGLFIDPNLEIDRVNSLYGLGDVYGNFNGCSWVAWDQSNVSYGTVTINGAAGVRGLELVGDPFNQFAIGDVGFNQNRTEVRVDDNVNEIQMRNNANNASVRMNGALGFTGTVTPVNSITVNGGIVTAVS